MTPIPSQSASTDTEQEYYTEVSDAPSNVDLYTALISPEDQSWFEKSAELEEDLWWGRGDRALNIVAAFRESRTRGEYTTIFEREVWNAIGYFARKSGKRIQQIATVCAIFPPEVRQPHIAFNYYEAAANHLPDTHWRKGMNWLANVLSQDGFDHPTLAPMGVGDFIRQYKAEAGLTPPPEALDDYMVGVDADGETAFSGSGMAFQSLLEAPRALRKLVAGREQTPSVTILLDLLSQVEKLVPAAMRELGLNVPK